MAWESSYLIFKSGSLKTDPKSGCWGFCQWLSLACWFLKFFLSSSCVVSQFPWLSSYDSLPLEGAAKKSLHNLPYLAEKIWADSSSEKRGDVMGIDVNTTLPTNKCCDKRGAAYLVEQIKGHLHWTTDRPAFVTPIIPKKNAKQHRTYRTIDIVRVFFNITAAAFIH